MEVNENIILIVLYSYISMYIYMYTSDTHIIMYIYMYTSDTLV